MIDKVRQFIGKLMDSRRRSVVCGLLSRHDVGSLILSRILGMNDCVKDLCRREEIMFVDVLR